MPKLPNVTGNQLIQVLNKVGFQFVRQKGSHMRLRHEDGRFVTVPVHIAIRNDS